MTSKLTLSFLYFLMTSLLQLTGSEVHAEDAGFLLGKWQVRGVRVDETLMRRPNYSYNDPALMSHYLTFSRQSIRTSMPEDTGCERPSYVPENESLESLVGRTMAQAEYSRGQKNKFALPGDASRTVRVIWISCKEGHIGPDTPSGPEGYNWVAVLAKDEIAMRWYDNTVLLLKRVKKITRSSSK